MILIISCTSPVKLIKGAGYLPENIKKRTLAVVPFIDPIDIKYSKDVSQELGQGLKEMVIKRFIYNQLRFGLRDSSIFNDVVNDTCLEIPQFLSEPISKVDTFPVLKSKQKILLKNNRGDIILFIFNFHVSDQILVGTIPGTIIPIPQNRSLFFKRKRSANG